jgi:hypothetical protein
MDTLPFSVVGEIVYAPHLMLPVVPPRNNHTTKPKYLLTVWPSKDSVPQLIEDLRSIGEVTFRWSEAYHFPLRFDRVRPILNFTARSKDRPYFLDHTNMPMRLNNDFSLGQTVEVSGCLRPYDMTSNGARFCGIAADMKRVKTLTPPIDHNNDYGSAKFLD